MDYSNKMLLKTRTPVSKFCRPTRRVFSGSSVIMSSKNTRENGEKLYRRAISCYVAARLDLLAVQQYRFTAQWHMCGAQKRTC